jgi:hypothetical protein
MLRRGITPVYNLGDGNCVFISLAQLFFQDSSKCDFTRFMISHRLHQFPNKYHATKTYCTNMLIGKKPATGLELQAIADICFSVVEIYSTENFYQPV